MRVEAATHDDLDRLADAWVELAREQRDHGTHLLPGANRPAIREDLSRRIVVGEVLVARTEDDGSREGTDAGTGDAAEGGAGPGRILGFVSFGRDLEGFETDRDRGIVHNLYVVPERRGEGIGAALLGAAEEHLAAEGVDVVALESMAGNDAARRFYRREGYRPHRIEFEKPVGESEGQDHDDERG